MKLKPKFDVATAKMLLARYAEKVVFYMKAVEDESTSILDRT